MLLNKMLKSSLSKDILSSVSRVRIISLSDIILSLSFNNTTLVGIPSTKITTLLPLN